MSRSRKEYITVHLNSKTLLAIALYSATLIGIGAGLKSCSDNQDTIREKITNVKTK